MPRITYIDTDAPHRERKSAPAGPPGARAFWKSLARRLLRHRTALLLVLAAYRFAGLGFGEMQQWDESIYALRAQVILQFGAVWDQSAFMLGGAYYSAHPPLYVWCSTAFLLIFGEQLWVYRLTSAVAAALLVPLIYRLSRMALPTLPSLAVTGLFTFAPLPAVFSRLGQLDMLLTLGMTAALYFAVRALRGGRSVDTLLAGCALGMALLTKLFFALSVPAAVALSAAFLPQPQRSRALRTAVLMTAISLPFWLPWAWSFAAAHGNGIGFLFSSALPLGATFAGIEGTAKDTGSMYYLNQLVVNLSLLFPFALLSMWRSLFPPRRALWIAATCVILVTLAALLLMRSSFEVYLIPILPLLFLHAVRGVALLRRAERGPMLAIALAGALCLAWSLLHPLRAAVKDLLRGIGGAPLPGGTVGAAIALLLCALAALAGVWLLYRRGRLRGVLSLPLTASMLLVLAIATCARIWIFVPAASDDGAEEAAAAVRSSDAARVFLIGNGDNPQLTFYLRGADIGWVERERLRYDRLEPRVVGVDGIRARIAAAQRRGSAAVLIERDEIDQGAYRAVRDILPPSVPPRARHGRYTVAWDRRVRPGKGP